MAAEDIDFEVTQALTEDDTAQRLDLFALALGAPSALAVGLDNSDRGTAEQGFTMALGGGDDVIRAVAEAGTRDPDADSLAVGVLGTQGGAFVLGAGDNRITADGVATGTGNAQVEAYGVLATQLDGGPGANRVQGDAQADGGNLATASGVRIGTFADNTVAVPEGEPFGNEAGRADLGAGPARVIGSADTRTVSDGESVLFNDANGVLIDVDSSLTTGRAADVVQGQAVARDTGSGGGSFLTLNALSADGVELRGDVLTGAGDDIVRGEARGIATNSFSVVEGVDIGLGNNLNAALGGNPNLVSVRPSVALGQGADRVVGEAFSYVEGDDAATVSAGVQNVGVVTAGQGDDVLRGEAHSIVIGGLDGIRGAIADGVQNFVVNDALGVDQQGEIHLGHGDNRINGTATAEGRDFTAFATGVSGGVVTARAGDDVLQGRASAAGRDEVGATGVYLEDANLGAGENVIRGHASAEGAASTDARGISVGLSDIDDDSLQNPEDSSGAQAGQIGNLRLGAGNDVLIGTADVTLDAEDGEDIFFAGANGIVNDGGLIEQLEALLAEEGKDLSNFTAEDVEAIIDRLETSTLNTGAGNDRLRVEVTLDVAQDGQGADDDLEIIGDGIENAGTFRLGAGDDTVQADVAVRSTIAGAKGLADALDNSSVGIITGLELEVNRDTVFDMGAGHDRFTSDIFATAVDDLSAADGLGNRGTFRAGSGDDVFDLTAESRFVLAQENDEEQQEGIADGWENRADVFLGSGNDQVTTTASAFGEGILTIAEGLESRGLFDTGSGDDQLSLTASATTAAVSETGAAALVDNLTQAAGLQTEQIEEGRFLTRAGDDRISGQATAKSAAEGGVDGDGQPYTPSTFAFGITQMTADANNAEAGGGTGLIATGQGEDRLDGVAEAQGVTDTAAFGILVEDVRTGADDDHLTGNATASSDTHAFAAGLAVGLEEDVFLKENSVGGTYGLAAEAGVLRTGQGNDVVVADAMATGGAEATARAIDGANGVINLGQGNDSITAEAFAAVTDAEGIAESVGIYGGELRTGTGNDRVTARSDTLLFGEGDVGLAGGQGFGGDVQINLGRGDDIVQGFGAAELNGGQGVDTLQFEFTLNEFADGGGQVVDDTFEFDGVALTVRNFEQFAFGVPQDPTASGDSDHVAFFETLEAVRAELDLLTA